MLLLQRLKVIKQWIDEPGADEKEKKQNWKCREPKIKPPAPGTFSHCEAQNKDQQHGQTNAQRFFFDPIHEPGAPMLDGLLVAQAQGVPINSHGQVKQIGKQY